MRESPPARVLLYDDQLVPGRTRADLLEAHLAVDVTFGSRVDDIVDQLLSKPSDLLILDYFDQSEFGPDQSCLDILARGTATPSPNARTPIIVHSVLTVPAKERQNLEARWNVVSIENRLFGDDHLIAVTARILGLPSPVEPPLVLAGGVAELVGWSRDSGLATVLLPSRPELGRLLLHRRDLDPELVRELDKQVESGERWSETEPLLLRVHWNPDAETTYELDLKVIQRLGPARIFRDQVRVQAPKIVVNPDDPTDTSVGRRVESRAPSREEWSDLAAAWRAMPEEEGAAG